MDRIHLLGPCLLVLAACGGSGAESDSAAGSGADPDLPSLPEHFWSAEAPADAVSVLDLRSRASGSEVVVRGEVMDFVGGLAAFQLADHALTSCADMADKDHCKTPWDFCCEDPAALTRGTAIVELREGGEPLRARVQGFHGIDHLTDVVVAGELSIDEQGNLLVVANAIHVE